MLDDPEIDAVYNPLPNHLHVPLTLAAAAKGKHVLCEKPISLNAAEAETLRKAPNDVVIAEAFAVRHHLQWIKARELVRAGKVGEPRLVNAVFSYYLDDPKNVRNIADIGGGGLYDIGCYPIVIGRYIFAAEPVRAIALFDRDPNFGTDRLSSAIVDFGGGRQLVFSVGTLVVPYQRVNILGTKGRVEVEIPFNPPPDETTNVFLDEGKEFANRAAETIVLPECDQYRLQAESFTRVVQGKERQEFGIEDAVLQMRVIDALFRSEKSGAWEAIR
jgi:predicted dehydrogenase